MNGALQLGKTRVGVQYALIAGFFLLLWLPTLDSFFHWDKPVLKENRALAKPPVWNLNASGAREFVTGLDAYYGDHFGFRNQLIAWQHVWKRRWFNESSEGAVMVGRDGWLYFSGGDMIDNFRAVRPFPEERLRAWQSLLEHRRNWLARRGIHYVFVIPPDKQSIYPEYLPEWMTRVNSSTKFDQFVSYMKTNSTVEVVDLRPALVNANAGGRTYYLTDTHWNPYGAFVGYTTLMQTIAGQLEGRAPLNRKEFDWKIGTGPVGDLTEMLGEGQFRPEPDCPTISPRPPRLPLLIANAPSYLGRKWPQSIEPVITENPDQTGTALIYRDSFSTAWLPFIGYHFHKVVYIWQRPWVPEAINQEKPDIVIDEILERLFYELDPKSLDTQDYLN